MANRSDTLHARLREHKATLEPASETEDWTMLGAAEPGGHSVVVVWRAAIGLFEGDRTAAERWLHKEAMGLGGKRPVDAMQADPQQVLDLIGRIEHGVYT